MTRDGVREWEPGEERLLAPLVIPRYEAGESLDSIGRDLELPRMRLLRIFDVAGIKAVDLDRARRRATAKQERGRTASYGEAELRAMLVDLGVETIPQQAVDTLNVDLGADPIAVEVQHHGQRPSTRPGVMDRCDRLRALGWRPVYVWLRPSTPTRPADVLMPDAARAVADLIDLGRRDLDAFGLYRIVGHDGRDVW